MADGKRGMQSSTVSTVAAMLTVAASNCPAPVQLTQQALVRHVQHVLQQYHHMRTR